MTEFEQIDQLGLGRARDLCKFNGFNYDGMPVEAKLRLLNQARAIRAGDERRGLPATEIVRLMAKHGGE